MTSHARALAGAAHNHCGPNLSFSWCDDRLATLGYVCQPGGNGCRICALKGSRGVGNQCDGDSSDWQPVIEQEPRLEGLYATDQYGRDDEMI